MRDRLEDLGRIYEILTMVLDSKLFEPDFLHYIENEEIAMKMDDIACEIELVKESLDKCWEISSAQDSLNKMDDECNCV
jgi:hypothetical protein